MTASSSPDVSVIMPAFRSAAFIETAIKSVQAQTGVSWELIIVDDASPDETGAAVNALAAEDPRIRYDRLARNGGPSAARNRALDLATGRFIAILDDDDSMAPDRLRALIDAAEAHSADIVVDNMLKVADVPGGEVAGPFLTLEGDQLHTITLADYIDPLTERRWGEGLGYLKPVFRRDALSIRYDERLRNSEDFYLVANLLAQGARMILIPDALYCYTVRVGSLSYRLSERDAAAILDAERRFRSSYFSGFDAITAAASDRQLRQRTDRHAMAALVEAIKAGKPGQVAKVIGTTPRSMPHLASELMRIAKEKITA